jgi:2-keto-4-pentenoate hydratase
MSLTRAEVTTWAAKLDAARRNRVGCDPISATMVLDIDDAYAIQMAGTELRMGRGEMIVGWKLGYTSLAMRSQMGIDHPNFGPLTDVMLLRHDEAVSPSLIQPRVEPEIGLRLARPLSGDVTVDDVIGAVGEAFACLEVVDSVYPGYKFKLEDNTADGSFTTTVTPSVRRRVPQRPVILRRASSGWLRSWRGGGSSFVRETSSSPVG